ncbi:hypothetical protein EYC80_002540 [Monilinia laxa]|uniref:Uncharacterized protein n=1 Tax=Monilinia laxa TaxID=61186 RepID=A0A5N6K4D7_MONLA|nr:hypothetical protein EYC80_002540 [Monilinia laxa]
MSIGSHWEPVESLAQIVERTSMISWAFSRNFCTCKLPTIFRYHFSACVWSCQSGWFNAGLVFIEPVLPKQ